MLPYRIPSPPEPDPPEAEHPYAAVLRAQARRARVIAALLVAAIGVLAAKAMHTKPPARTRTTSEASRVRQARTAIAGARERAAGEQQRFESGVRRAIGEGVVARPDLGACPIVLPAKSALASRHGAFPLLTVERADLASALPSQAIAEVLADVNRAEAHLASGRYEEATLYARALARPERLTYDVVLVAKQSKKPLATSASAYEPGEVAGRAYVYDFASGRVLCAGDIHAASSKRVGYTFSERADAPVRLGPVASMGDAISEDIRLQTQEAIAEAVRWRAGPAID